MNFPRSLTRLATPLRLLLPLALMLAAGGAAPAPRRVVSINVCTDQLAMLIAGEGQLHSVSMLARDPNSSAMTGEAESYAVNHALAEEIFLMRPDLVLAGTFSSRATVSLLRRLGLRVEEFAPANALGDIRGDIVRIGALLGRQERAGQLAEAFDVRLAALAARPPTGRSIALYESNSYTTGKGTLADEIIRAAGLVNVAAGMDIQGSGRISLETLIVARPDLLATSRTDYGAPALAQENFVHPAFAALAGRSRPVAVSSAETICGTPFTLEAAFALQRAAAQPPGQP